jgi:hypothetical protein
MEIIGGGGLGDLSPPPLPPFPIISPASDGLVNAIDRDAWCCKWELDGRLTNKLVTFRVMIYKQEYT